MRNLSKIAVVVALALSLGAHWAVLQSVAWVSMVVKFAQHDPLTVALAKTFDGQHPCAICLFIAAGKKAEQHQRSEQMIPISQLDFFLEKPTEFYFHSSPTPPLLGQDEESPERYEPPPSPPPRQV